MNNAGKKFVYFFFHCFPIRSPMQLFILVLLGALVKAETSVIGVPPSKQELYQPIVDSSGKKTWHCLSDPSIVLSYDQINDDYCDCPDGSDEPGTNACPYNPEQGFYCENKGHIPAYIENFKLNDGVCDYDLCCDGSDEYLTGLCPDKCAEIHQQYSKYKQEAETDNDLALAKQQKLIEKAQVMKQRVVDKLAESEQTLAEKQQELKKLQNGEGSFIANSGIMQYVLDILGGSTEDREDKEKADRIEKLEKEIKSLESDIAIYQENLAFDFGKDDIFRAVVGTVITASLGEYQYSLDLLGTVRQDATTIGKFSGFKDGRLVYTGGEKCWNGPKRSAEVELICGSENRLLSVGEPEKCQYLFRATSPLLCEKLSEEYLIEHFKVDYSLL